MVVQVYNLQRMAEKWKEIHSHMLWKRIHNQDDEWLHNVGVPSKAKVCIEAKL